MTFEIQVDQPITLTLPAENERPQKRQRQALTPCRLFAPPRAPQQSAPIMSAHERSHAPEAVKTQAFAQNLFSPLSDEPPAAAEEFSRRLSAPTGYLRRPVREQPPKFEYHPKIANVPYMPRCGYFSSASIQDPFNRAALNNEKRKAFEWQGRIIPFDTSYDASGKCRTFVGGAHCLLSRIPASEDPLIDVIPNESIIMKTFLAQSILSKDENISVGEGAAQRVLQQHRFAREAGIAVPSLYNVAEADEGCGYFLFEFIPNPFEVSWDVNATPKSNADFAAIYQLFYIAAHHGIDLDLRPSNLRRRDDGSIVLVDFLESEPKKGQALYYELENRIKTFCQPGDAIYNQLLQAITVEA